MWAAKAPKKITAKTSNKVLGSTTTLYVGGPASYKTLNIKATVTPKKASQKVKFKTGNKKVATVNSKGKVTAKKAGTAKITVYSAKKKSVKKVIKIKVKKYVYPASVTAKAAKSTLYGGETTKITASVSPKNATVKGITYKSSSTALATVSSKGVVTANKNGKTGTVKIIVTAKDKNSKKKTVSKTVSIVIAKKSSGSTNSGNTGGSTGGSTGGNTGGNTGGSTGGSTGGDKTDPNADIDYPDVAEPTNTVGYSISYEGDTADALADVILRKTGDEPYPQVSLVFDAPSADSEAASWTSSDEHIAEVDSDGNVTAIGTGTVTIKAYTASGAAYRKVKVVKTTASVHDPSIFKDPKEGLYYVTGTGLGLMVSQDCQAWSATTNIDHLFTNSINELKPLFDWTGADIGAANAWAADLIYNPNSDEYYMYVCVASGGGHKARTAIGMCSSKSVTGPYTYKGMIVVSDFNKTSISRTNLLDVLGVDTVDDVPSYYYDENETTDDQSDYYMANYPDTIDPAPFFGHDGELYMTYGSFTIGNGIHVLKLDKNTGLRSTATNYERVEGDSVSTYVSDPYFGKRITQKSSGEGPYILPVPCDKSSTGYYYYLWTSSGTLRGTGNYRMQLWRSENPDGPFLNMAGGPATTSAGITVTYNYKYSFMDMAYTAMGGNSAFYDEEDGKILLCYHNKFEDNSDDPGTHMVKVHQMFINEDGWLVTTPFEYRGETAKASYSADDLAGAYEIVLNNVGTAKTYGRYNYNKSTPVKLTKDGKVTGTLNGTWAVSGNNITITTDNVTYKGSVIEQYEDDGLTGDVTSLDKTMTITLLGSNSVTAWATKVTATNSERTAYDLEQLVVTDETDADFNLDTSGLYGSKIKWTSSNPSVISVGDDGKAVVTRQIEDTSVKLTASVTYSKSTVTKDFDVKVKAFEINVPSVVAGTSITLPTKTPLDQDIIWTSSDPDVINVDGTVTQHATETKSVKLTATIGDKVQEYDVLVLPSNKPTPIYSEDYEEASVASEYMTSLNYQEGIAIGTDVDYGNYLEFNTGSQNSRGAYAPLGDSAQLGDVYTLEADVFIRAGNGQETQFVLYTGDGNPYNNNNGLSSDYILKLNTTNSTTWTVNDSDITCTMPAEWVHLRVIVNTNTNKALVTVTKGEDVLFDQNVNVNGSGLLKGIYLRGGRYNSLYKLDNFEIY